MDKSRVAYFEWYKEKDEVFIMVFSPDINWKGNIVTANMWGDCRKEDMYTIIYDCEHRNRIDLINMSDRPVTEEERTAIEDYIQEEFDKGSKIDHINCTLIDNGALDREMCREGGR